MDDKDQSVQGKIPAGARSSSEALEALQRLYIENEALYLQPNMFIEQLYGYGELSWSSRSLLLQLFRSGERTLPQLARARNVSRQYMYRLVHQLAKAEYIHSVENAEHKRSYLVQLTAKGRDYLLTMLARESKIVAAMDIDLPATQLQEAATTLRKVREWQKVELGRLLEQEGLSTSSEENNGNDYPPTR